jgi:hypothetical protein
MKFLQDATSIDTELRRLLKKYREFRWATAWASTSFEAYETLKRRRNSIRRMVVGIHFYQTHPDFIAEFLDHENVRFQMNPDGVFHPKLYLFEGDEGRWEAIIGSANFTASGLSVNSEAAVLIGQDDLGAEEAHGQIIASIDGYWESAKVIRPAELDAYRAIWSRQQTRLSKLSGRYSNPKAGAGSKARSPLDVPLFVMSWVEYYGRVRDDKQHSAEGRLAVLEEAARLFRTHGRFAQISQEGRKGIAGFGQSEGLDWLWFGSMKGAGYFKEAVNRNDPHLSDALDEIPLDGPVTRRDYEGYIRHFGLAFPKGGGGVATATRLLAMKRPDYFLCLDSKNLAQLCDAFGISKSVGYPEYWDAVVDRLADSVWWNVDVPEGEMERRVWRCRAAFLDVLFYEP